MANLTSFRKALSTLRSDTLFLLRDPNGERYATARIDEKLNETCLSFCLRTQLIKDEINILLAAADYDYDIKALVAADVTKKPYAFAIRIGYDGDAKPALLPGSLLAIDLKGYTVGMSGIPQTFYFCATSYGVIQILGAPTEAGDALPLETGNLQVSYVAMPTPMVAGDPATIYPDTIPAYFHKYLPYGAAALILEEGDKKEMALADYYESEFNKGILEQISEEYASSTPYDECHPL
jgi:hypothetical protein